MSKDLFNLFTVFQVIIWLIQLCRLGYVLKNELTTALLTCTLGLAEAYSKKRRLMEIPITIPSSRRIKRHEMNVTTAGMRSISIKKKKKNSYRVISS